YRRFWQWSDDTLCSGPVDLSDARDLWRAGVYQRRKQPPVVDELADAGEWCREDADRRYPRGRGGNRGVRSCFHDAFLIATSLDLLDETVATMRALMARAGATVTGGLPVRTDAVVVRWPDRYLDERGVGMWKVMMRYSRTCANLSTYPCESAYPFHRLIS